MGAFRLGARRPRSGRRVVHASPVGGVSWKLVVTRGADGQPAKQELYNLATDLGEANDLSKVNTDILDDLKRRLEIVAESDKDAVATD